MSPSHAIVVGGSPPLCAKARTCALIPLTAAGTACSRRSALRTSRTKGSGISRMRRWTSATGLGFSGVLISHQVAGVVSVTSSGRFSPTAGSSVSRIPFRTSQAAIHTSVRQDSRYSRSFWRILSRHFSIAPNGSTTVRSSVTDVQNLTDRSSSAGSTNQKRRAFLLG